MTLWNRRPLFPTICSAYVPAGAEDWVETVTVDVADPVRRETDPGSTAVVALTIVGENEALRLTLPAKLFWLVKSSEKLASDPRMTLSLAGLACIAKSGFFAWGPVVRLSVADP